MTGKVVALVRGYHRPHRLETPMCGIQGLDKRGRHVLASCDDEHVVHQYETCDSREGPHEHDPWSHDKGYDSHGERASLRDAAQPTERFTHSSR